MIKGDTLKSFVKLVRLKKRYVIIKLIEKWHEFQEVIGDTEELFSGRGGEPCLIERVNKKL